MRCGWFFWQVSCHTKMIIMHEEDRENTNIHEGLYISWTWMHTVMSSSSKLQNTTPNVPKVHNSEVSSLCILGALYMNAQIQTELASLMLQAIPTVSIEQPMKVDLL